MGKKDGITPRSRSDIEDLLAEGEALDIAEIAREHSQGAIDTLAAAMDRDAPEDERAPWSVSTKAAKDIIEIGHGRSAVQEKAKEEGGITVVINQLTFNDASERVISADQVRRELEEAQAIDVIDEMSTVGRLARMNDDGMTTGSLACRMNDDGGDED